MTARKPAGHIVIAGVGKSGTTSLFRYLGTHPEICPATVKETHYFSPLRTGRPLPPVADYEAFFRHQTGERYRLEASPDYCVGGPAVRDALRTHLGRPRIVIALREPVDRLHDNFWYMKSKLRLAGFDRFDDYVDQRLAARADGHDRDPRAPHTGWLRSFYGDYLGAWFDVFGPDLRIVFFEHLVADPARCIADLFTWLGVDPAPARRLDASDHNATQRHRSPALHRAGLRASRLSQGFLTYHPAVRDRLRRLYLSVNGAGKQQPPPIDPATRARLEAALAPSTRTLAELLARHGYDDVPEWVTRAATTGSVRR